MKGLYKLFHRLGGLILKTFYRYKVYQSNSLPEGGVLIACNHASFADPVIAGCALKEEIGFLARKTLFRFPIFGPMIRGLNAVPISRGGVGAAAFKEIQAAVKKGKKVLIFPEGTRTRTGELQKVQNGIAILLSLSQCPLVPVYIEGSFKAWGRHMLVPKPWGRISCVVGSPIPYSYFSGMDKAEFKKAVPELIEERLAGLQKWLRDGAKGPIP